MGKKSGLITCKHCGQVIAASAKTCPHCGGKNGKPVYKKWWFWVLVGFFAIGIMDNAVGEKSATVKSENSVPPKNTLCQNIGESVTEATKDTHTPIPVPTEKPQDKVPTEYRNALKKAETYSEMMHMSKKGIYDQLTSEYGEKFDADAAQYAIDNVTADWNANALAKAKEYQKTLAMSKSAIYDQLTSEYGEKFTAEEAQYAVDNLE